MNLDLATLSEQDAAAAIAENPRIMYRPLLTDGKGIAVGFDPDRMQKLLP